MITPEESTRTIGDYLLTGESMEKTSTMKEAVMDMIRTLIKSYGGYLVANGMISNSDLTTIAGAAAIGVGLFWSWMSTAYLTK